MTDAMIADAQDTLGVRLPETLVALLRRQNGGLTRGFVFPTKSRTSWSDDHVPFDELFGIGRRRSSATGNSILDTPHIAKESALPTEQVVLAGDGHWYITLDYRNGDPPSVSWIDVEVGEDVLLAPSFDDFLAGLVLDETVDGQTAPHRRDGVFLLVAGSLCLLVDWGFKDNPWFGGGTIVGSLASVWGLGFALHGASLAERRMRLVLMAYSVAGVVMALLLLQWLGFFEIYRALFDTWRGR
ncbi:MAG TPA: SMI1/KNR4 family protein [Vicinamibacteria bacterium]|nr:SMI1/KNR4 family protein [Vicinamibacteria bacterium]